MQNIQWSYGIIVERGADSNDPEIDLSSRWKDSGISLDSPYLGEIGNARKPTWIELGNGLRPPQPQMTKLFLGEWAHGWQYHASNSLETTEFQSLFVSVHTQQRAVSSQGSPSLAQGRVCSFVVNSLPYF